MAVTGTRSGYDDCFCTERNVVAGCSMHDTMSSMGTRTGRMSQTNPDLQSIPGRPDLVKKRWVEPERVVAKAREGFANYL